MSDSNPLTSSSTSNPNIPNTLNRNPQNTLFQTNPAPRTSSSYSSRRSLSQSPPPRTSFSSFNHPNNQFLNRSASSSGGKPTTAPKSSPLPSASSTSPSDITKGIPLIQGFLKSRPCYDLLPGNSKVVVFDTQTPVLVAFNALVDHNVKGAMLWNSTSSTYIGIITVSDFVEILRQFYQTIHFSMVKYLLSLQTLQSWWEQEQNARKLSSSSSSEEFSKTKSSPHHPKSYSRAPPTLITLTPDDSIHDAVVLLQKYKIHRIPILTKEGTLLHILTHAQILRYVVNSLQFTPTVLNMSLESLGIGTYRHVATVLKDYPLLTVLNLLSALHISSVPVIDELGHVIDIYSKSDIAILSKTLILDLKSTTVSDALSFRPGVQKVFTCSPQDSLATILLRFVQTRVHRLVCVDDSSVILGIVSLTDILRFFISSYQTKEVSN